MTGNGGERTIAIRGGEIIGPAGGAQRADVLVTDGVIAEVGEVGEPAGTSELDASGCYLVPGLINAHYHSGENFNPGLYENLPLDLWFVRSHQVTRTEPPAPEVIYARTILGAMIMLRAGTTAVVDFLYEAPEITIETLEPVVRAYRDAGIRATIVLGVADRSFAQSLPLTGEERKAWPEEAEAPTRERILEMGRAAIDRWHEPDGMIGIGWGPSAPQRCSEELLRETMEMSRSRGLAWQTHVLETRTQAMTSRQWHQGGSFVEVLDRKGLLGPDVALVHAVWLNDRDIDVMARTQTTAVHCLASNLRLGDGVARVPAMRRAGVRLALGTDGRGCYETLDLLELARMTALVHKARGGDHREWITASQSLSMLTRDSSVCTGHGERLGRIEPGAHGDLVIVDAGGATFTPLNDPVRQLLYGGGQRNIRAVVVGGELVVESGRLTRVDEDEMLELAGRCAASDAALLADGEGTGGLDRIVDGLYQRAESSELDVDAYIPW
jgi:5-methylthioadenosine/S-adenosylhomocysteine deaminase